MANYKLLAKLRSELEQSNVVSLRPDSGISWTGLSCAMPAYCPTVEVPGHIEDRLEEASAIVRGLLETATTHAEQADLLRVLELLRH